MDIADFNHDNSLFGDITVKTFFQTRLNQKQHFAETPINQCGFDINGQKVISTVCCLLGNTEKLGYRYHGGKRGVFEQTDKLVAQRRYGNAECLWRDNAAESLHIGHTDGKTCFPLAFRYGQNCRAYGFGSVCADIERKADDGGRNRVDIDADGRQTVEYDDQLHQKRRTANDGNIKFHQLQQAFLENAAGGMIRTKATATAIIMPITKEAIAKGKDTAKPALTMGQNALMSISARVSVINGREARKLFNTDVFSEELFAQLFSACRQLSAR